MLKIHEIFRSVQGEGMVIGVPMTFVRTFGCNLSCPGCDTPQDSFTAMTIEDIVRQVQDDWVCLTGGEPTIQEELPALVNAFREQRTCVAIETNGTNPLPEHGLHWVCVSPKSVWPGDDILYQANEIKLVVGSGMYNAEEVIVRERRYRDWILLQPWWDDDYQDNLQEAIRLCQKHQVRLSFQTHKYIGVK